jgi:hypothetical protein
MDGKRWKEMILVEAKLNTPIMPTYIRSRELHTIINTRN